MNTFTDFIHMGGYAFYVWTSYGLMAIILLANVIAPIRRRRRIEREFRRRVALEHRSGSPEGPSELEVSP